MSKEGRSSADFGMYQMQKFVIASLRSNGLQEVCNVQSQSLFGNVCRRYLGKVEIRSLRLFQAHVALNGGHSQLGVMTQQGVMIPDRSAVGRLFRILSYS